MPIGPFEGFSGGEVRVYLGDGQGRLSAGQTISTGGWPQGICAADWDNDGDLDLAVAQIGVSRLLRNSGGKLEDATAESGLPVGGRRYGAACAFTDFDRDGKVDLFISNYVDLDPAKAPKPGSSPDCIWRGMSVFCGPKGLPMARNALYRNLGGGKFADVSERAGILKPGGRYGLGVVAADFNNDGWPDIYVACDQTPSLLYENNRTGGFVERAVEAGVAYNFDGRPQSGMGVAVADYDGNGFLDIVKTNFSGDLPSLYLNEDGRFFHDASREAGLGANQLLGWGVEFFDADEDGWKDLIIANGHVYPELDRANLGEEYRQRTLFYRNLGTGRFADLTASAGPGLEPKRPSRGLAIGDIDQDGRPEIVINNIGETPTILRNTAPRGHWLRLELTGTKSNRSAIGARVTVTVSGRKMIDEVRAGGSYYSQSELTLTFGLGAATVADRVEVRWPSGKVETRDRVAAEQTVRWREGQ